MWGSETPLTIVATSFGVPAKARWRWWLPKRHTAGHQEMSRQKLGGHYAMDRADTEAEAAGNGADALPSGRTCRDMHLLPPPYEVKSARYSEVGVMPVSSRCSRARVQAT